MVDSVQGFLQGPIRAMGLQNVAFYFALVSYWLIAIPLAIWLAIGREMGVMGLHMGILGAVLVQCIAYLSILLLKDWQKVADEAQIRIADD